MSEELLVSEHTDLLSATDRQDEGQAEGMEVCAWLEPQSRAFQ